AWPHEHDRLPLARPAQDRDGDPLAGGEGERLAGHADLGRRLVGQERLPPGGRGPVSRGGPAPPPPPPPRPPGRRARARRPPPPPPPRRGGNAGRARSRAPRRRR